MNCYVDSYMDNGCWKVQQLREVLPWEVVLKVVSIHAGKACSGNDRVIWGWSNCGNFNVKTAYSGLVDESNYAMWKWKFIWSLKIPTRVQHFLWSLLHGKILTNLHRTVRGLDSDPTCPRCHGGIEDIEHLFRSCSHSMQVWKKLASPLTSTISAQQHVDDWFGENLKNNKLVAGTIPNSLLFSCSLWMIWKWRCSSVFDCNFSPPQSSHLVVYHFAESWLNANTGGVANKTKWVPICWEPPGEGWVKLNTDGSVDSRSGQMAAGGVLRNDRKAWMEGFVVKKGVGSVLEAELWGVFEGLSMAWRAGIRRVIVEIDSLESVQLISKDSNVNHPFYSLIQNCKNMVEADWNCFVKHVHREANNLADGLAHMGQGMKEDMLCFEDPPPELAVVYDNDCRGLASVKLLATPAFSLF